MKKFLFRLFKITVLWFLWKLNKPQLYNSAMYWYYSKQGVRFLKEGEPRYIDYTAFIDGKDYSKIVIGEGVVISRNCILLVHDFSVINARIAADLKPYKPHSCMKEIHIGNNVFIGAGSIILPGTVLEDNCIVGAGSVVRGHYSQDSLIIGNPASKIGSVCDFARKREKN